MMLAVSTPQKLGMAFAVALVVGWAIFILAHIKRGGVAAGAEVEVAPNRKPYLDDDKLEGIKLERALVAALILLVQPTDTPLAPHPQANALPFGCATCHGNKGQGGVTNYAITDAAGKVEQ